MLEWLIDLSRIWLCLLIGVLAVKIVSGTETARRLVLNDLAVNVLIAVLALSSLRSGETDHLQSALALALLSFVGSIVVAAHALRRESSP